MIRNNLHPYIYISQMYDTKYKTKERNKNKINQPIISIIILTYIIITIQ